MITMSLPAFAGAVVDGAAGTLALGSAGVVLPEGAGWLEVSDCAAAGENGTTTAAAVAKSNLRIMEHPGWRNSSGP